MEKLCIYCGKPAKSVDHIPSKGLFPSLKGYNLITVPACKDCNKGFSLDEQYFRDHIVALTTGKSLTADYIFDSVIKKSVRRRPALAIEMFSRMSVVDYYSPHGVYLGKRTAVQMPEITWERIFRILTKTTKGLFYYHFKTVIPDNFVIKHIQIFDDTFKKNDLSGLLSTITWQIPKYDNVFRYGFAKVPELVDSVWLSDYYQNAGFMTFVRDPKNIA
jgi:hypothetical protein